MLIKPVSVIAEMSGKMSKSDDLVFYSKYGKIFAWNRQHSDKPASESQMAVQAKFKAVNLLVTSELASEESKAKWAKVALESNGKYATARGACFAHLWDTYVEESQS